MLIVEDQFIVAAGIEKTFKDAGARDVTLVGNMRDAWETVRSVSFDAALLDIRLGDGLSFPLAMHLFTQKIPVVIHSGHAEIYHAVELPGAVFCPKPAKPQEIVASIVRAKQLAAVTESAQPNDNLVA